MLFNLAIFLFLSGIFLGFIGMIGKALGLFWIGALFFALGVVLLIVIKPPTLRSLLLEHLRPPSELKFSILSLPSYRFVDLHRSIQAFVQAYPRSLFFSRKSAFSLQDILAGSLTPEQLALHDAQRLFLPIAPGQEDSFPDDAFWVCRPSSESSKAEIVLRLREAHNYGPEPMAVLEIAAPSDDHILRTKDALLAWSVEHSIYRKQVLELDFFQQTSFDTYHAQKLPTLLRVFFKPRPTVSTHDIVLDEEILPILRRNVLDLHKHRSLLKELGLPAKKGLLFYGPPGTGKTFTSQYLCRELLDTTVFLVTGKSLIEMEKICSLARLFQPSLVIMEDVDLVFSDREINLYSSSLGDFMDQLDGFQPDDAVIFLLTTNAIERLERAIKDRPGRISQCIFFGPPHPALCKRYLQHYLQPYPHSNLDLQRLASLCEGTTQAFIKELVFRSVQISLEENNYLSTSIDLLHRHFQIAYDEMTGHVGKAAHTILGFRVQRD